MIFSHTQPDGYKIFRYFPGHILTFQFYTAIIPPMKDKGVLIQAGT